MTDTFNIHYIKNHLWRLKLRWDHQQCVDIYRHRELETLNPLIMNYLTHLGGTRMKMKFKGYNKISVGSGTKKYPMIEFKGTQIGGQGDGEERNYRFFPSEKDMYAEIKNATSGDILSVKLTQNGKYWNPTGITNETKDGGSTDDTFKSNPERSTKMNEFQQNYSEERRRKDSLGLAIAARNDTDTSEDIINRASSFEDYLVNGLPDPDNIDLPEPDMDEDDDD